MNKKDFFYFASYYGVPIYYQPEDNEIVGRNKLCDFLLEHYAIPMGVYFGHRIKLRNKCVSRQRLIDKGLLEK